MDLPSFLWLWKIAAWSMGLSVFAYSLLAISGLIMAYKRYTKTPRPAILRPFHYITGLIMVGLILLLLTVGIVGTLGHYGNLGHSPHLIAGLSVVVLGLTSALTGLNINPQQPWRRYVHITTNIMLLLGFVFVSLSGWTVVQKYLP
jgi:hypothetical protein